MNKIKTHDTMSPEAQRIAIAKECGTMKWGYGLPTKCVAFNVPDYPNDLNACHEFEKILDKMADIHEPGVGICSAIEVYEEILLSICDHPIRATAAQRCEAFLKTIDKWKG